MPFLPTIEFSETITTAEYSILAGTTVGVPTAQTTEAIIEVVLDLSAQEAGDQVEVNYYEKPTATSLQKKIDTRTFTGAIWPPAILLEPVHLKNGYDITIRKITGTNRLVGSSARRVG